MPSGLQVLGSLVGSIVDSGGNGFRKVWHRKCSNLVLPCVKIAKTTTSGELPASGFDICLESKTKKN